MTEPNHDLATSLADSARIINSPRSVEDTLDAIVRAARQSVPGVDEVGISVVHRDGTIETKAATGSLVWDLDELQYKLNEGPCVEAIREGPIVATEDVLSDSRWPRYAELAAEAGLGAQLGVQLWADDKTLGGLNLYSLNSNSIGADSVAAAELFATHAAIALGRARIVEQLHEGMENRGVIGMAIGIIMERHRVDEHRAFQYLTRVSSTTNFRIRTVAQEIVDQVGAGRRPSSTPAPRT
ncbi:ANTAR domain-containing protein [Nocardioides sp. LHG3406-4]|uniref:ANTAR domain-containing protein n=1 Tax=Nocardioides sp. LHG3406-4 TaxID=2804575 RepID=UPI003CEDE447